jgi:hypothetical protein
MAYSKTSIKINATKCDKDTHTQNITNNNDIRDAAPKLNI